MKTVYRVEHKRYRHGPYNLSSIKTNKCRKLSWKLVNAADTVRRHPSPCMDGIRNFGDADYCGFESLEQLMDWFEDCIDELHEHEYHVCVFEVPEWTVKRGRRQVVFRRKDTKRKRTISLLELKGSDDENPAS